MPENSDPPGSPASGTSETVDRAKLAAAALLIAVLLGLVVFLVPLVSAGFQKALTGEDGMGRFFLLILDSSIDPRILAGIAAVVGVGSAFAAGGGLPNWLFYSIVVLCGLAILLLLIMWILLSDDTIARELYNFGSVRIADADSFRTATRWTLGETIFWVLGVLGAQVKLRASRK